MWLSLLAAAGVFSALPARAGELEDLRAEHQAVRDLVRAHCPGMGFDQVTTPRGETYRRVIIVSADRIRVAFRHEDEQTEVKLRWVDAPLVWQRMFGPGLVTSESAPETKPPGAGVSASIAVIEGDQSNGTGFFCKAEGRTWLYTAAHVISGNSRLKVKLRDGRVVRKFGALEAAEGADLVRLPVEEPVEHALEICHADGEAKVGVPVMACGNSGGGGTVGIENGKVMGVGAESIEIDAQVIQGNSGGPILDGTTHRVLGVVTHLTAERKDHWAEETRFADVRRFGCRLDRTWVWKTVPVEVFLREGRSVASVKEQSELMLAAMQPDKWGDDIFQRLREDPLSRDIATLQVWIRQQQSGQRTSEMDRKKRLRGIFESARHRSRGQMAEFKPEGFTWFHRETGKIAVKSRGEIDEVYDSAIAGVR